MSPVGSKRLKLLHGVGLHDAQLSLGKLLSEPQYAVVEYVVQAERDSDVQPNGVDAVVFLHASHARFSLFDGSSGKFHEYPACICEVSAFAYAVKESVPHSSSSRLILSESVLE
jgi:hypothetical protein